MKNKGLLIIPALVAAINAPLILSAKENIATTHKTAPPSINAACSESTTQEDLSVNNVRCRILMGDMWWDLANAQYEVPKGGGVNSIFAGSLWIGGVDVGGQLKVAAQTYRQTGNDFWPGPLDTTNASVDLDVCAKYDKHFHITRKEVENFVASGETTPSISNWPGNGDMSKGQAKYLAPFFDKNGDGMYTPSAGDYPGFDLVQGDGYGECQSVNCVPVDQLFGDECLWWVFNDKGNIHGETGGQSIGLEIRAQAFGFFTDDEINNMTFYNYRIFNRSTFQVDSCYFGVWCDADLGCESDDYVGCDVKRGLGYTYNGDNDDNASGCSAKGYGPNPPAIGIDFFRGPIADAGDGKDNDRNCQTDEPCEQIIMSGFLYYNNTNGVPNGNPTGATHFYNYLRMRWGDGTSVVYNGKDGYPPTAPGPVCNFMYPGNPSTDEHDWGIGGTCSTSPVLTGWDEVSAGNTPADRRMLESAGPFTLMPGAVNVITTGVAWAKANSGGAAASVSLLRVTDDKAQALFDNCFKVLDGPDAPDVTVQELDKELILYLSNTRPTSNNYNETYSEFDPLISLVDTGGNLVKVDTTYDFEGYKIYQLKNATVSANDLDNPDKARLVAQCDFKNGISRVINFELDQNLGALVPKEKVNGADAGIVHSIPITTDAFSTGSPDLINHKTYYYMAVAYGFNEFKKYQENTPPAADPFAPAYDGQKKPYKQGRKNLKLYSGIPHISTAYSGGTEMHGAYGSGPMITRIEGNGNGRMNLEMTSASISSILSSPANRILTPEYEYGAGPINVKVVDPLNVPDDNNFVLKFDSTNIGNSTWKLINTTTGDTVWSDKTIKAVNEQLIPQWGISVAIEQVKDPGSTKKDNNGFIGSSMSFSEPSKQWLTGVPDKDGPYYQNWIRCGTTNGDNFSTDYPGVDSNQVFEGVVGGTWSPYRVCACTDPTMTSGYDNTKFYGGPGFKLNVMNQPQMKDLASINLVITSDKSKWTRCTVLEMCEDARLTTDSLSGMAKARKLDFRRAPSVDKNGLKSGDAGYNSAEGDLTNTTGMGWFPGYAINLETGERLNIAFGENSALSSGVFNQNGGDMKWNPTKNSTDSVPWDPGKTGPVFGGQHYIYVFGHNKENDSIGSPTPNDTINIPRYDEGKRIREILGWSNGAPPDAQKRELYRDAMWVNIPLLASGHSLLESDVTIRLRVAKSYKPGYSPAYYQDGLATIYADIANPAQNNNLPMYTFNTNGIATHTAQPDLAVEALDLIRAVPNPYYAFSSYEKNSLDNRVKITNLPEGCTVSIYNLSGTLIRQYTKGEIVTNHAAFNSEVTTVANSTVVKTWDGSIDWDLKNTAGIPISSGVYIIHVEVPGVGEKVVKWFGVMRPITLDTF